MVVIWLPWLVFEVRLGVGPKRDKTQYSRASNLNGGYCYYFDGVLFTLLKWIRTNEQGRVPLLCKRRSSIVGYKPTMWSAPLMRKDSCGKLVLLFLWAKLAIKEVAKRFYVNTLRLVYTNSSLSSKEVAQETTCQRQKDLVIRESSENRCHIPGVSSVYVARTYGGT